VHVVVEKLRSLTSPPATFPIPPPDVAEHVFVCAEANVICTFFEFFAAYASCTPNVPDVASTSIAAAAIAAAITNVLGIFIMAQVNDCVIDKSVEDDQVSAASYGAGVS